MNAAQDTAATPIPDFSGRRQLAVEDLPRLEQPALIFEGMEPRTDSPPLWVYTVVGWLDGSNIATEAGGCTVGGEAIGVFAATREAADEIAYAGFYDTVVLEGGEQLRQAEAIKAMERLTSLNPMHRLQLGMANDNPQFRRDAEMIRAAGFGHELGVKKRH